MAWYLSICPSPYNSFESPASQAENECQCERGYKRGFNTSRNGFDSRRYVDFVMGADHRKKKRLREKESLQVIPRRITREERNKRRD